MSIINIYTNIVTQKNKFKLSKEYAEIYSLYRLD